MIDIYQSHSGLFDILRHQQYLSHLQTGKKKNTIVVYLHSHRTRHNIFTMKILATSLWALIGSVACMGENVSIDVGSLEEMQFKDISVPDSHVYNSEAAGGADGVISERGLPYWGANIYNNYQFAGRPLYYGWIIRLINTYQFRFQGTTWAIPSDVNGATYLANNFASSVNSLNHDQAVYRFTLPGGWCFDATAAPGWTYSSIPRQMLIDWVLDHCANYATWTLPSENAFQNAWLSSTGQLLYYFRVYPCNHNGVTDHGETYNSPGQPPAPW